MCQLSCLKVTRLSAYSGPLEPQHWRQRNLVTGPPKVFYKEPLLVTARCYWAIAVCCRRSVSSVSFIIVSCKCSICCPHVYQQWCGASPALLALAWPSVEGRGCSAIEECARCSVKGNSRQRCANNTVVTPDVLLPRLHDSLCWSSGNDFITSCNCN